MSVPTNKRKIINDPVYGFITIPTELIFDLMDHPWFQRLRRIRQMGLASLVYPGATHTRFHHALGAMHLMGVAIKTLCDKGHAISDEEAEAAQAAILLHDIGHGPFSHVLEATILRNVPHERVSLLLMDALNAELDGRLDLAIRIFTNRYERPFFHQLVSSQLDTDRLDYLKRDCYFTGVSEGNIGASRLLKMLEVRDEQLVIEEKGIYSVESFLNARRVMYWQVYLHKASLSAEQMLVQAIRRARFLYQAGEEVFVTPTFRVFLADGVALSDLREPATLRAFAALDDYDVWTSLKGWAEHPDSWLSLLSRRLLNRKLFRIAFARQPFTEDRATVGRAVEGRFGAGAAAYLVSHGSVSNAAYLPSEQTIKVLTKRGEVKEVAQASDLPNIRALSQIVKKYYLCWPKDVGDNDA